MMVGNGDKLFFKATNEFLNDEWIGFKHQSLPITADNVNFIFEDILNCSLKITYKTSKKENKEGGKDKYIQRIEYI